MSIGEELLAKNDGNKMAAGAELVLGLMRGNEAEVHQGYSIGNALYGAIDTYNLTLREIPLVVERVIERTDIHYSATRRPLVIIGVGGGLIQWTIEKRGLGTPRVHILDYDKEGCTPDELGEFIEDIGTAMKELRAYGDAEDAETINAMTDAINEYAEMLTDPEAGPLEFAEGTDGPGRYR